ncbi:type II secretion system protein [Psychrobium sp. 1_MG-2023]|uniref:type II secretion system protein n=1 Tax=Psychrobium sp. 1_MG-2023 TaxID=3062624 RepID=UPI0026BB4B6D|nr:prepilin-type N-terminal cleavage/methylation domain-containing protein [Psychrobium sp. 1_MG-2023]MDP2561780.1 type II secretion system protein [Psychrobium sp. 1_MG-2023]
MFFPTRNIKQHSVSQHNGRYRHTCYIHSRHLGFTLIELLTVITLLAITATVALTSYNGTQEQGRYDMTKFEMTQLREALLQFRQDSGSNDFPRQGAYDCTDVANDNPSDINPNIDGQLPVAAGNTDSEKIAWCQHPANLWMLFADPLGAGWNMDTKRGWNGPYLQRKDGYLTLTSNTVNLIDISNPLWSVADPYTNNSTDSGIEWSLDSGSDFINSSASPYLFRVDLNNPVGNYQARIIAAGSDGLFEDNDADECHAQAMDHVLCLLN